MRGTRHYPKMLESLKNRRRCHDSSRYRTFSTEFTLHTRLENMPFIPSEDTFVPLIREKQSIQAT